MTRIMSRANSAMWKVQYRDRDWPFRILFGVGSIHLSDLVWLAPTSTISGDWRADRICHDAVGILAADIGFY